MKMSDVLKKSELTLWQNYCDKKIECERLTEENAKLREFIEKQIPFLNSVSAQKAQQLLNQLKDQNNDK